VVGVEVVVVNIVVVVVVGVIFIFSQHQIFQRKPGAYTLALYKDRKNTYGEYEFIV